MKSVIIIAELLVVATMVYSFNESRLRTFYENIRSCSKELGVSPITPTVEAILCALEKDGKIVKENGELSKEACLDVAEDFISDASKVKQAKQLFITCYSKGVQSGATGREQTLKICTCCMPGLRLLDKL